jgi:hemerythrin-like domain-containing protein
LGTEEVKGATMKRSAELRDLSEQHHHGLVAARRLRQAAEGKAAISDALAHFLDAWDGEIQAHFRAEEEVLLPEFARAVAPDDALIVRTLKEHVALRRAVRDVERARGDEREALAREIGQSLEEHIRFEERELFPAVEAVLAGPRLEELGRELRGVEVKK